MREHFTRSARSARLTSLLFGIMFAVLVLACLVDRSETLSFYLGRSFMMKWLALGTDWPSILQLALMSAGGFGLFGIMTMIHGVISRSSVGKQSDRNEAGGG